MHARIAPRCSSRIPLPFAESSVPTPECFIPLPNCPFPSPASPSTVPPTIPASTTNPTPAPSSPLLQAHARQRPLAPRQWQHAS
eukprot:5433370-Pleurochrysis_carterae.AAC.2